MYFIASSFSGWSPVRQTGADEFDTSAKSVFDAPAHYAAAPWRSGSHGSARAIYPRSRSAYVREGVLRSLHVKQDVRQDHESGRAVRATNGHEKAPPVSFGRRYRGDP
jgi:hypothetical protein